MWFTIDGDIEEEPISVCTEPFLLGLLVPAMYAGEKVVVEGTVSKKLFNNIHRQLMTVLRILIPSLNLVKVEAELLVEGERRSPPSGGVMTGFSGGVDSFSVLRDNMFVKIPSVDRVTHILYHNIGSFGKWGQDLYRRRLKSVENFSQKFSVKLLLVDSNLDSFYQHDFQQTHTIRSSATAMLFQPFIKRFLYASSYTFPDCVIKATHDMAFADPIILPLLSTENLECVAEGNQYSRVKKTQIISEMEITHENLHVCTRPTESGINCSMCKKCRRTMITLDFFGKIEDYADVFELEKYRKHYFSTLSLFFHGCDPFSKEIMALAREKKIPIPWFVRLLPLHLFAAFKKKLFSLRFYKRKLRNIKRKVSVFFDGANSRNGESKP